ncbi:MAG: LysR family transcriptional regulator, partial [Gammaproteobacteria bacterium]|nr:LysR family transcriptional regulator [Gammaproteobacteria bacterium]
IKMLVSVGLGWSLLPRTLLDAQVIEIPVQGLQLARTLGVVRHRERTLSNAGEALIKLLVAG